MCLYIRASSWRNRWIKDRWTRKGTNETRFEISRQRGYLQLSANRSEWKIIDSLAEYLVPGTKQLPRMLRREGAKRPSGNDYRSESIGLST
jgi:hypothetical protein